MRLRGLFFLPLVLIGFSFAQSTNFPVGPQYLITTSSTMFLHPIATPSLSLNAPMAPLSSLAEVGPAVANQAHVTNPQLPAEPNLFPIYYGYPVVPVMELSSSGPTRELPASVNQTGFLNAPNAQSLRALGYGSTIAQAAAWSKAHRRSGSRVYTNEDIQRLRP